VTVAARIRLLTSVHGDGPVVGDAGDVLEVDHATAEVWADGVRAERVIERQAEPETAVRRPRAARGKGPTAW
jgi:ribosomal protein L24